MSEMEEEAKRKLLRPDPQTDSQRLQPPRKAETKTYLCFDRGLEQVTRLWIRQWPSARRPRGVKASACVCNLLLDYKSIILYGDNDKRCRLLQFERLLQHILQAGVQFQNQAKGHLRYQSLLFERSLFWQQTHIIRYRVGTGDPFHDTLLGDLCPSAQGLKWQWRSWWVTVQT